jgi:hypothetical protein
MQNKPNFLETQMSISPDITKYYGNFHLLGRRKNKAKTNPIQTQFIPTEGGSNPISDPALVSSYPLHALRCPWDSLRKLLIPNLPGLRPRRSQSEFSQPIPANPVASGHLREIQTKPQILQKPIIPVISPTVLFPDNSDTDNTIPITNNQVFLELSFLIFNCFSCPRDSSRTRNRRIKDIVNALHLPGPNCQCTVGLQKNTKY